MESTSLSGRPLPGAPPRPSPVRQRINPILDQASPLVHLLRRPLLEMVLLCLVLDVLEYVPAPTRAVDPVQEPPGAVVGFTLARVVDGGAARDTAEEDARDDGVARGGEGSLAGAQGGEEDVGEKVGAQDQGREKDGDEAEDEQRQRVVAVEVEGAGRVGVAVAEVEGGERRARIRVEEKPVGVVGEAFAGGEEDEDVLEDLPGEGQGGGGAKERLGGRVVEGVGEAGLGGG